MLLYHGTTGLHLPGILRDGIQPRKRKNGNWKHTVPSNPNAVYLTDAYPAYFAFHAGNGKGLGVVLEIDTHMLDHSKLHPDEDVLEQAGRKYDKVPGDMLARTLHYRTLAPHNPHWRKSLEAMGTCGYYATVPVNAITRYAVIDWQQMPMNIKWDLVDTSICLVNYQILRDKHRAYVRWMFGDEVQISDLDWTYGKGQSPPADNPEWTEKWRMRKELWTKALSHKLNVVQLRN